MEQFVDGLPEPVNKRATSLGLAQPGLRKEDRSGLPTRGGRGGDDKSVYIVTLRWHFSLY